MKYSRVKEIEGAWRVMCGQKRYFVQKYATEHDAKIAALQMSGRWYHEQLDKCQKALEKIDPNTNNDPTGWLA